MTEIGCPTIKFGRTECRIDQDDDLCIERETGDMIWLSRDQFAMLSDWVAKNWPEKPK